MFASSLQNVGIDIGRYSIKIAAAKKSKKSFSFTLSYSVLPEALRDFQDKEGLKDFLASLLKKAKLNKSIQPILHLTADNVVMRDITLSQEVPPNELAGAVELELLSNLPFNIDEVYFDFQPTGSEKNKFLAVAAKRQIADEKVKYVAGLNKTNKPCKVDVDVFAYERVMHILSQQGTINDQASLIVDIGSDKTQLFFFDKGKYSYHRDRQISGKTVTEIAAEAYQVSFAEAEKMKFENQPDDYQEKVITPFISQLSEQIGFTLDFYSANNPSASAIEKVYITGGSSKFSQTASLLSESLKMPVETLNLDHLKYKTASKDDDINMLDFALAIGLAI